MPLLALSAIRASYIYGGYPPTSVYYNYMYIIQPGASLRLGAVKPPEGTGPAYIVPAGSRLYVRLSTKCWVQM